MKSSLHFFNILLKLQLKKKNSNFHILYCVPLFLFRSLIFLFYLISHHIKHYPLFSQINFVKSILKQKTSCQQVSPNQHDSTVLTLFGDKQPCLYTTPAISAHNSLNFQIPLQNWYLN